LTWAFVKRGGEVHQVIGPSYQFLIGLSDPTLWHPERGWAGDPGQRAGAFSDLPAGHAETAWEIYTAAPAPAGITFTSPGGKIVKTALFTSAGIQVEYRSQAPVDVQIPLVIDPWRRFTPGWEAVYRESKTLESWAWGVAGGPRVAIRTTGVLNAQAFNASYDAVGLPEDPNFAYPPGHYLPFPMALAVVRGEGAFDIELTIHPGP
jgi:hypothetical protein